ncbi:MAG: hypothetical protein HY606_00495 [Planctomycetes bacterium]|nr:hypothetical protein [Planctomycetota bacterium]
MATDSNEKDKLLAEFEKGLLDKKFISADEPKAEPPKQESPEAASTAQEENMLIVIDDTEKNAAPESEEPPEKPAPPAEEKPQIVETLDDDALQAGESQQRRRFIKISLSAAAFKKICAIAVLLTGLYWCILGSYHQDLNLILYSLIFIFAGLLYMNLNLLPKKEDSSSEQPEKVPQKTAQKESTA